MTIHLQNVVCSGGVQNVKTALKMIDGVRAVQVNREEQIAEVLYRDPATQFQIREILHLAGYLAEPHGANRRRT